MSKEMIEVKVCSRCGKEQPKGSDSKVCIYCGSVYNMKYVVKEQEQKESGFRKLMLLTSKPLSSVREFLSLFFFRSEEQLDKAVVIFDLILKGELTRSSYKNVPEKLDLLPQEYYVILNRLKAFGVIDVVNERYVVSKRFIEYLHFLEDFYMKISTTQ